VVLNLTELSKRVSQALRHVPWRYGLRIDTDGWVDAGALLDTLREQRPGWADIQERDLANMILQSSRRRHELRDGRIRALYGHSLPERLDRVAAVPPPQLYHGTAPKYEVEIRNSGLLPMRRQYVHLSSDPEAAIVVGKRKSSKPLILTVDALQAWKSGVPFYTGGDNVWLADHVASKFIDFDAHGPDCAPSLGPYR
jgi:putative RNA 2'-phosphotransferase